MIGMFDFSANAAADKVAMPGPRTDRVPRAGTPGHLTLSDRALSSVSHLVWLGSESGPITGGLAARYEEET
jgi:hypothetical protein